MRREEKIRFGDENAVDGKTGNRVVCDDDRVSGEESQEARERLQETEIGEGETLRNNVISDGETKTIGGGLGEISTESTTNKRIKHHQALEISTESNAKSR